ncbi:MAG: hypothetical protein M1818_006269 [Claussenomyces sp. TS43310]|nr:MAG: hypothetical protein M1818_006269 [Claussenomyces sp. TS43310]
MAQGAVATMPTNGVTSGRAQSMHEIEELRKIVRFRDAVLAGHHPQFKVPANVVAPRHTSSPNVPQPRSNPPPSTAPSTTADRHGEEGASPYNEKSERLATRTITQQPSMGKSASSGSILDKAAKSGINPILLEKSDDLIKAEIQLQRQRLERALREQVEQRRISLKAALQTSESLPDFDLSDVLFKALTIVHPSTASDVEPSVGGRLSASDSFDENTFYSSQHDTPEQSSASLVQKEAGEVPAQGGSTTDAHLIQAYPSREYDSSRDMVMTRTSSFHEANRDAQELAPAQTLQPMLNTSITSNPADSTNEVSRRAQVGTAGVSHRGSQRDYANTADAIGLRSEPVSNSAVNTSQELTDRRAAQAFAGEVRAGAYPGSPRVYAHNLSPIAPQPARLSPLVANKLPPIIQQPIAVEEAQPAQVAALRQPISASSPESSPKGSKTSEKKKGKKKKTRKSSGKQTALDTPDSPYIKPEPRSPSPFSAAPLPRPRKRQRQTLQQGQELNYDEPRYEETAEEPQVVVIPRRYEDRPQPAYIRPADDRMYDSREAEPEAPVYPRALREDPQYRRVVSHDVRATSQARAVYAQPYSPVDSRLPRAASHMILDRHGQEPPRHYGQDMLPPRTSVRPDADRERSRSPVLYDRRTPLTMAPPRLGPRRIVVDEYGRQFYAPSSTALTARQSVAPLARRGEEDVVYEQAPLRAVPRAVADSYEQDGVIYRRSTPLGPPPQRIVSQPEYESDYRAYRPREPSLRPAPSSGLGDEYIRVREPVERRQMSHFEELPREYTTRVGSVRPEAIRYEASRQYVGRLTSVRPEPLNREYAASVRPEVRREVPAQPLRQLSVRPEEPEPANREYIPIAEAGYAPPRPILRRVIDDVEYIERPREVHQAVYADNGRREVIYR